MAEKVIVKSSSSDLDGAQFENAATEATLKRLVDLMEKQKPGGGAAVKKAADQAKQQGINPKVVKDTEDGLSSVSGATKAVSKTASSFGSALSFLASGPLALLGSAFSMVTSTISESMDALRATGGVGASFNGSLLEINKAAASAGMSLEEYSGFVKKNSQLMAAFGGTATEGAKRMGELAKGVRQSEIGQQMQALGVSTDTMNGALADYMNIQAQQGRLTNKSNAELTKGAGDYLKNLGELSRLTGLSVEEQSKSIEAQEKDARVAALIGRMGEKEQEAFRMQMAKLTAQSPKLAEAFKDGMIGLGNNPVWNQLKGISPELDDLAQNFKKGKISQEEYDKEMAELAPKIGKKLEDMSEAGELATEEFTQLRAIQMELNKTSKANVEQAKYLATEEGKNSTAFTKSLMTAKDNLNAFWGTIKTAFLESAIFKRITDVVDWAATKFLELKDPMMKFVKTILDTALPVFDKVGQVLSNIVNSIMSTIAPQLPLLGRLFSNISNTIVSLIDPALDLFGTVAINAGKVFSGLLIPIVSEVWSVISNLATGIINLVTPAFTSVGGAFTSFLPAIDDVIKVLRPVAGVIIPAAEAFVLVRGAMLAWQGAQIAYNGIVAAGTAVMTALRAAQGAGIVATLASTAASWAAALGLGALAAPVIAVVAAVVALGIIFKALYDNGWTLGSAWEAMSDAFGSIFLDLKKAFSDMIDYLKSWVGGGRSEKEKKQAEADYEAEKALYKTRADARDAKRAEVRKERGTEDSLLNLSAKGTSGSPAATALTPEQKAQMVGLPPGTTTAATAKPVDPKEAERQRLIDERTNQILGVSSKPNAAMPNNPTLAAVQGPQPGAEKSAEKESNKKAEETSNATAEAVVATATTADETLKISYQQVATLNTVSDQLNTLNEVMKEILKLHHDQIDTQKDLVNVTKGKYSPI